MAIYIFTTHKKGISSYQLARDLSITQKTGWFVLHRLRYAMSHKGLFEYYNTGEFEVDEAYIGGKLENKHRQGKDTHGLEGFKPRTQAIVFGMVQRGGNVYLTHIPKANKKTIEPIIAKVANKGSVINSDEHSAYGLLSKNYVHQTVIHSNWEYVRGSVHTNTIEGVWSLLKRGIYGIYHQTSKKHLQAYCDEFSFRHNRRKYSEYNKVNACLLASTKGSLKYKTLVNKGGENAQI
jgi:transposase